MKMTNKQITVNLDTFKGNKDNFYNFKYAYENACKLITRAARYTELNSELHNKLLELAYKSDTIIIE